MGSWFTKSVRVTSSSHLSLVVRGLIGKSGKWDTWDWGFIVDKSSLMLGNSSFSLLFFTCLKTYNVLAWGSCIAGGGGESKSLCISSHCLGLTGLQTKTRAKCQHAPHLIKPNLEGGIFTHQSKCKILVFILAKGLGIQVGINPEHCKPGREKQDVSFPRDSSSVSFLEQG